MKIHFRLVDGERTLFLELADRLFCGFGTGEHLADLPGEPLKYSDMNATLLKRLREKHFLDVDADMNTTWGTVTLRLPDPVTLLKTTRPGEWKQARDKVKHKAAGLEQFQAFAQWWETLRRSEAYRRDCEALRVALTGDVGLTLWAVCMGKHQLLSLLAFAFGQGLPRGAEGLDAYAKGRAFCYIWGISRPWPYPFLFPKTEVFDVAAFLVAMFAEMDKALTYLKPPGLTTEKSFIFPPIFQRHTGPDGYLKIGCHCLLADPAKEGAIVTALFREGIPVENYLPGADGIRFTVKPTGADLGEQEANLRRIIIDAIGTDLPTVHPWNERQTLNPEAFRRQLAAFDKRTDEDAELWPGKTGQELSKGKHRARERFKERLARLEHAAEERRRTLTTD